MDCQAPSSKTLRPVASSIALQATITSVGAMPLLRANGRGVGPACALAANTRTMLANACPSASSGTVSSASFSTASAQRTAISLASAAKSAPSDGDIDFSVLLDHVEFLQPDVRVATVATVRKMKFIAMPRANDMHVVLVIALAAIDAFVVDQLDDLRHAHALARRTTLVRTKVTIG